MMVRAGMFVVDISDSHGRAYTIGHRTATHTATHVPVPVHATLHHTLPNATCHSKQSCGDQANHLGILPGTPLASSGALGAHEPPQVQTEGSTLSERENEMENNVMGSPFCPGNCLLQSWLSCRIASMLHLRRSPPSDFLHELHGEPRSSPLRLRLFFCTCRQPLLDFLVRYVRMEATYDS
jgi:hypothetical protein